MKQEVNGDNLHRLMKQALDDGSAESIEDAKRLFEGYRLSVSIGSDQVKNRIDQITLLTIVALASRIFLGGVYVCGDLDVNVAQNLPFSGRLSDVVLELGGQPTAEVGKNPLIVIGGKQQPKRVGFSIRTQVSGWRAGICPSHAKFEITPYQPMPLAASLSAALAVNEVYLHVNGSMPTAGLRTVGASLWRPNELSDWMEDDSTEPVLTYLPSKLWLVGLGHLGQAYLWNLAFLPYANPSQLSLVLQDVDVITESTHSTSILTLPSMVGQKKTRCMAKWAEERGFSVNLLERYFAADFQRQSYEPTIALCGLDNALGRQALDKVGFDMIVEAGLGRGHQDFRKLRLHVLPGQRPAEEIWPSQIVGESSDLGDVYNKMVTDGKLDQCGATLLSGKAVGAPFVGMVASCFAISEILRLLHGGKNCHLIDIDLVSMEHRHVVSSESFLELSQFNPGYTDVIADQKRLLVH